MEGIEIDGLSDSTSQTRFSRYVEIAGFIAIYAILLSFFKPDLILSATTTAGGDTGAHHYVADFLIHNLLPNFKITGWSPGWYAGFPMLHFYFPFPFLLIALLSTVIKYQVAFKIVTVLGIFLLPLTTYLAFKVLDFRFPLPIIAAVFTLPFLFMESYTIYGGNILSTLAGEFGYSLSFSLSILFLALLYRDIKDKKFRVSTAVLLAVIALSHIVTTIVVVAISTYFLINGLNMRRFAILAGVFVLGFVLSAFWSLPFLAKIGYTAHMQWDQLTGLDKLFPELVRPFLAFSAIGLFGAIYKRDSRSYLFFWATVLMASLFFLLPQGRLWNGRLVPFFYFFTFMWAGYGIWVFRELPLRLAPGIALFKKRYLDWGAVLVTIAIVATAIYATSEIAGYWIKWNYSGFEGKASWKSFDQINRYIKELPPGRVMVEHSQKIDEFGTPRAFELLPYFANHPTMEGTLMEASFTAPFHFVNQAELSKEPSYAILGIDYPQMDIISGVKHLELYNIKYFLAVSKDIKNLANMHPGLELKKKFKVGPETEYALYEVVNATGYVSIPRYRPLLVDTGEWRETALKWYSDMDFIDVPLIHLTQAQSLKGRYKSIPASLKGEIPLEPTSEGTITGVRVKDDELTFSTTAVGEPHWIKISYFPNWKAEGADGPYLASPSLMMVIPTEKNVRIYYGDTWSDTSGRLISLAGWLFVAAYALLFIGKKFD